jgi:hypothetical protein
MAKRGQEAPKASQEIVEAVISAAPAIPPIASSVLPEAAIANPNPKDGWIDMNKPMSFEEYHRVFDTDSPFLASHIR